MGYNPKVVNSDLSNLAPVTAASQDVSPASAGSESLGTAAKPWLDAYIQSLLFYSGAFFVKIQPPGSLTSYTLTLPSNLGGTGQALTLADNSGTLAWVTPSGGGGANAALSNLSATAINQSLIAATSLNLGSQANPWNAAFINSLLDASNNLQIDLLNRAMYDASTLPSLNWTMRRIYGDNGLIAATYNIGDGYNLTNTN